MRLISARIENFRLLRCLEINFSSERSKPLTVIRAENASGKTSTLKALRWGLFGHEGLDEPTERLSPVNWPEGQSCEVKVSIVFEHTVFTTVETGREVRDTSRYTLERTVTERPVGKGVQRDAGRVSLYLRTDAGSEAVNAPEARLNEILPLEMKNIFFTDGDAAMDFISPDLSRGARSQQVKSAIRSLLGLGLLEDAERVLKTVQARLTKRQREETSSDELANITVQLEGKKAKLAEIDVDLTTTQQRITQLERQVEEAEKELQRVLTLGNYQELAARRQKAAQQLDRAKSQEEEHQKAHSRLLESRNLSWAIVGTGLQRALRMLQDLHDRGSIPKTSIPVLRDRLAMQRCICGTSLEPGSDARRQVEQLIDRERDSDDRHRLLTTLYHTGMGDLEDAHVPDVQFGFLWDRLRKRRLENIESLDAARAEISYCEEQLAAIDAADIEDKRAHRDTVRSALEQSKEKRSGLDTERKLLDPQIVDLAEKARDLRRKDDRLKSLDGQLTATEDLLDLVRTTLNEMQEVYLKRVSDRMNTLFLEMVGAEPTQGTIYQGAEITPSYEIIVMAPDGRTLNPDHEVNGASKRALTFAFVWALTEVSGVAAPRVIDTPLGMMSGAVKRRVLDMIAAPASDATGAQLIEHQVVLFLTQAEIANTEDILDKRVGRVATFTNSDHFPKDLVHRHPVEQPTIMMCACSHKEFCDSCQRRDAYQYHLVRRN